jgi:hypothetical protein
MTSTAFQLRPRRAMPPGFIVIDVAMRDGQIGMIEAVSNGEITHHARNAVLATR